MGIKCTKCEYERPDKTSDIGTSCPLCHTPYTEEQLSGMSKSFPGSREFILGWLLPYALITVGLGIWLLFFLVDMTPSGVLVLLIATPLLCLAGFILRWGYGGRSNFMDVREAIGEYRRLKPAASVIATNDDESTQFTTEQYAWYAIFMLLVFGGITYLVLSGDTEPSDDDEITAVMLCKDAIREQLVFGSGAKFGWGWNHHEKGRTHTITGEVGVLAVTGNHLPYQYACDVDVDNKVVTFAELVPH